jgi:hypothetical protein
MTNRSAILNELHGLGSTLADISPQNIYEVPDDYFEGLANQVLNRIKALEASNAKEELEVLSPALNDISKEMPFVVPAGYFENLSEKMMQGIREHADYLTSDEEIASLSPLLSSISKQPPYKVPAGYFENLNTGIGKKEQPKIISIASRKWYRLAAVAVLVGFITISGILLFSKGVDPNKNPQAWVKKNVEKKVSRQQLDEFVILAKEDENLNDLNDNDVVKSEEIKALMKDVPEKEIQEFLNETVALKSNDATDALLN